MSDVGAAASAVGPWVAAPKADVAAAYKEHEKAGLPPADFRGVIPYTRSPPAAVQLDVICRVAGRARADDWVQCNICNKAQKFSTGGGYLFRFDGHLGICGMDCHASLEGLSLAIDIHNQQEAEARADARLSRLLPTLAEWERAARSLTPRAEACNAIRSAFLQQDRRITLAILNEVSRGLPLRGGAFLEASVHQSFGRLLTKAAGALHRFTLGHREREELQARLDSLRRQQQLTAHAEEIQAALIDVRRVHGWLAAQREFFQPDHWERLHTWFQDARSATPYIFERRGPQRCIRRPMTRDVLWFDVGPALHTLAPLPAAEDD